MRQLRQTVAAAKKNWDKTEDDLKALQSVGQIIGEVLRQLDDERCASQTPLLLYCHGIKTLEFRRIAAVVEDIVTNVPFM